MAKVGWQLCILFIVFFLVVSGCVSQQGERTAVTEETTVPTQTTQPVDLCSSIDPLHVSLDTGFRPGVDNWQFTNFITYLTPKGSCKGMSLSSLWYFNERKMKEGSPPLWGQYLGTNTRDEPAFDANNGIFGLDHASAIKFTAVINKMLDDKWPIQRQQFNPADDVFKIIACNMSKEGRPQLLDVINTSTEEEHVTIVHRIEDGKLFVTDPNYPKEEKVIVFKDGKFQKYDDYFDLVGIIYQENIPWRDIKALWGAFDDNGLGKNYFADIYPNHNVFMRNCPCEKYKDGFPIAWGDFLRSMPCANYYKKECVFDVDCYGSISRMGYEPQVVTIPNVQVKFYVDGKEYSSSNIPIKEGRNYVGMHSFQGETWVDFDWVVVEFIPSRCPQGNEIINCMVDSPWGLVDNCLYDELRRPHWNN